MAADADIYSLDLGRVSVSQLEGEAVVLDLQDSSYLMVNSTGAVLLRVLSDGAASHRSLLAALQQEFTVAEDIAANDVAAFLGELESRGWLR